MSVIQYCIAHDLAILQLRIVTIHSKRCQLATVATKTQILEAAGYKYNFDREVYFNRKAKKTFSVEFVEDHKEHEIEQYIQESTPEMEWHFYFNSPPSEGVKRQLAMILTNA